MNHLIDRYVWAVSEKLPQDIRRDVADELHATISDMADAREGNPDDATREVLVELGDPAVLARRYGGSPRHLVGPEFYPDYVAVLKVIAASALPFVLLAQLVVSFWDPDQPLVAGLLGATWGTAQVGIHIVFWTTLTFVVLERSGVEPKDLHGEPRAWDPSALPAVPPRRQISRVDLVVGVVMLLSPIVLLWWQRFRPVFEDPTGEAIPVVNPDLWSVWIPLLFVLIAVNIGIEVWKYREGRWTLPVTVANAVINLVWVAFIMGAVLSGDVINPEFTEAMREAGNSWNPDVPGLVTVAVAILICVWDTADSVAKHLRVRRCDLD